MTSKRDQGEGDEEGVGGGGDDHLRYWCGERGGRGVMIGLLMSFVFEILCELPRGRAIFYQGFKEASNMIVGDFDVVVLGY